MRCDLLDDKTCGEALQLSVCSVEIGRGMERRETLQNCVKSLNIELREQMRKEECRCDQPKELLPVKTQMTVLFSRQEMKTALFMILAGAQQEKERGVEDL